MCTLFGTLTKYRTGVKMKVYTGTFVKSNGDIRTMRFVRMGDLPRIFLEGKIKNTGHSITLIEGKELVWDVDKSNFRIFDWNTTVGDVSSEISEKNLIKLFDNS